VGFDSGQLPLRKLTVLPTGGVGPKKSRLEGRGCIFQTRPR
jgi:hypothetical protein